MQDPPTGDVQPLQPEISFGCPFCEARLVLRESEAEGSCPDCNRVLKMRLTLEMSDPIPDQLPASERFFRPAGKVDTGKRKYHPPKDWR